MEMMALVAVMGGGGTGSGAGSISPVVLQEVLAPMMVMKYLHQWW